MTSEAGSEILVSRPGEGSRFRMSWGEEILVRQSAATAGGRLSVMDVKAPPEFGPGRHVHREDDEVLLVRTGELVLWSPERMWLARAGDVVFMPRRRPHAWFNPGDRETEFTLLVTPGQTELFFPLAVETGLTGADRDAMVRAAAQSGVDPYGPPLTREEVDAFLAAEGAA